MLNNKVIVVTGGAGFIGSNLCEALLKRGDHVICFDNFATGKIENIKLNDVIITSIISRGDDSVNGTTQTTISLNFKSIERKMYAYNSQTGVWTAAASGR